MRRHCHAIQTVNEVEAFVNSWWTLVHLQQQLLWVSVGCRRQFSCLGPRGLQINTFVRPICRLPISTAVWLSAYAYRPLWEFKTGNHWSLISLIYRTETTTKKCKTGKLKSKHGHAQKERQKSGGIHVVSPEEEKERLRCEWFAEKKGFKPKAWTEKVTGWWETNNNNKYDC